MNWKETDYLAEVLEVNGDIIKLQLPDHPIFESELVREFPLATPYGSGAVRGFDFLPEIGSKVLVHLSGNDLRTAFVGQSLPADRLDGNGRYQSDTELDPEVKAIRLKNGNALLLESEAIRLSVQKQGLVMESGAGIQLSAKLPLQLLSGKGSITLSAKSIVLKSEEDILISGGMSSLIVGEEVHLKSATLIQANS